MQPIFARWGYFDGEVQATWLRSVDRADRLMRLEADVTYVDPYGVRWTARAGLAFDGASIPRLLWSIVGSPFDGDYRDAALIHDQGYRDRTQPRASVDRMMYHAMRACGVRWSKARLIYLAVRAFGPRWTVGGA